jgi:ABC-type lipoprotein release transport system permease subunit
VTLLLDPHANLRKTTEMLRAKVADFQAGNPGGQELEVMSWEEIQPGLRQLIDVRSSAMYIVMMFLFVVVAAGIMNTFLMAVFERIREFGILMSLGTRPAEIFLLVMTESAIVGIIGALAGLGLGLIAAGINTIYPWHFNFGDINELVAIDLSIMWAPKLIWSSVMRAVVGIISVTLIAAVYPAIKAALLRPVEALRHV